MINFRYHLVSLIAVFLALGIGVIMGSAVIDRAVVDRLEKQQASLRRSVDDVRSTNRRLTDELRDEQDAATNLLTGTLTGTPVLVVVSKGAEGAGLADFVALLERANARYLGAVSLTKRFALANDNDIADLAAALNLPASTPASALRTTAIDELALALRASSGVRQGDPLATLRSAGFVEFSPPPARKGDVVPTVVPQTRLVVVAGPRAAVPDSLLALPLLHSLVGARQDNASASVIAVSSAPPATAKDDTFIGPIRKENTLEGTLSTVDDLDEFAGRLASILALGDLTAGRVGDYGRGPGAQRLLPAPPP